MDGISCSEQSELESLCKENREKTKCIEELEAREQRFVQQIGKLEGDLVSLKAQFERYCANMHCGGNASTTSSTANPGLGHNSNHPGQQTSTSSSTQSTMQQGSTSQRSGVLSQAVIQHFNTLGIDLRKFYNQMDGR